MQQVGAARWAVQQAGAARWTAHQAGPARCAAQQEGAGCWAELLVAIKKASTLR